jgi:poly(A) polymerase
MRPLQQAKPAIPLDPSRFPPLVKRLGEYFASTGTPAYLVGGVVRDALMHRHTGDIDLAVAGRTRQVGSELAEMLSGRSVILDEAREIVRVAVPDGGGQIIDLTPLSDGIQEDLSRRDFTLDATALSIQDACAQGPGVQLIDPYGGVADMEAGVIRAMSPSVFAADPARLMRAPRLAAQLRFRIERETAESIRRNASLLGAVAPERVREELLKLLAEPSAASWLRLLDDLWLLCLVIPELTEARGVTQPREHYWDVLDHSIETAGQLERVLPVSHRVAGDFAADTAPRFPAMDEYFAREAGDGHNRLTMLKLAGLLHDIAKPATRTVDASGRIRFLGHQKRGAEMAAEILGRLRLSRRGIGLVSGMVEHHLRPGQMSHRGELPTARAVYRYYRDVGDAAIDTLYLNMADYLAARGPLLRREEWADYCRTIDHVLHEGPVPGEQERAPRLVNGHDIIKTFSLAPGPKIGALLELVREAQASGEIASRDEAIQLVKSTLSSGGGGA